MAKTCRCPVCGRNAAGGRTRRLYLVHGIGRDKRRESRLLRTRMAREMRAWWDEEARGA